MHRLHGRLKKNSIIVLEAILNSRLRKHLIKRYLLTGRPNGMIKKHTIKKKTLVYRERIFLIEFLDFLLIFQVNMLFKVKEKN